MQKGLAPVGQENKKGPAVLWVRQPDHSIFSLQAIQNSSHIGRRLLRFQADLPLRQTRILLQKFQGVKLFKG